MLSMWAGTWWGYLPPLGQFSASLGRGLEVPGDQWHGMACCKSHRCYTITGRMSVITWLTVVGKGVEKLNASKSFGPNKFSEDERGGKGGNNFCVILWWEYIFFIVDMFLPSSTLLLEIYTMLSNVFWSQCWMITKIHRLKYHYKFLNYKSKNFSKLLSYVVKNNQIIMQKKTTCVW